MAGLFTLAANAEKIQAMRDLSVAHAFDHLDMRSQVAQMKWLHALTGSANDMVMVMTRL